MPFPIDGPLEPSLYLQAFSRYSAPNTRPVQIVIVHARYHVNYAPYVKFGYIL